MRLNTDRAAASSSGNGSMARPRPNDSARGRAAAFTISRRKPYRKLTVKLLAAILASPLPSRAAATKYGLDRGRVLELRRLYSRPAKPNGRGW
jgi:hypothetical protein